MLAVGDGSANQAMSYMLHGGGTAGTCHDNYFDPTSSYGAIYPNSFTGWTVCGNYNMKTGQLLSGESACPTGIRDIICIAAANRLTVQPNPFRSTIDFHISGQQAAAIIILDTQGHLIKKLEGLTWDGTDTQGARVRPGVYVYRMMAGEAAWCGKIFRTCP
jgi:hypothetical protein